MYKCDWITYSPSHRLEPFLETINGLAGSKTVVLWTLHLKPLRGILPLVAHAAGLADETNRAPSSLGIFKIFKAVWSTQFHIYLLHLIGAQKSPLNSNKKASICQCSQQYRSNQRTIAAWA